MGYDKAPFLFKKSGDEWKEAECLDKGFESFKDLKAEKGSKDFFKKKEIETDIKILEALIVKERDTKHENTIQQLVPFGKDELCTADDNGNIFFWKA